MSCSPGSATKICAEPGASAHTFDTNSEPYRFWRFGVRRVGTIIDDNTVTGSRSHQSEFTRAGPYMNRGAIHMPPYPVALDRFLERALGGTKDGSNDIAVAETIPAFGLLAEYYSGQTIEYEDCKLNRLIIRGEVHEEGETPNTLEMILDVMGLDSNIDTSYPALTLGVTLASQPYTFQDVTTTQISVARKIRLFQLEINNHLEAIWRNGQLYPDCLLERDRTITLTTASPYFSTNEDLYNQSAAGTTGTLVLTNSTVSCTFTFGVLQAPVIGPTIEHKGEILLPVHYQARMVSTTREVVARNDSTP